MKRLIWLGIPLLLVLPLLAQEEEFGGGEFERDEDFDGPQFGQRENQQRGGPADARSPLEQIGDVLSKAGVPLSADRKKTLQAMMDEQRETMQQRFQQMRDPQGGQGEQRVLGGQVGQGQRRGGNPQGNAQMRQEEEAYQKKLLAALTPEQQAVWKKYQRDQTFARGGYPALRLALEEAGALPAPEQETQLQEQFRNYNRQQRELRSAAGPSAPPEPTQLKELETQHLSQLAKLLNPAQRRALIEWYRNSQKQSD